MAERRDRSRRARGSRGCRAGRRTVLRALLAAAVGLGLAACGGSGGSGGGGESGARPSVADSFSAGHTGLGFTSFPADGVAAAQREFRFTRQDQIYLQGRAHFPDTIGLAYARALGFSGRGVTVAVVDDGFRVSHETFRDTPILTGGRTAVRDHGTSVASRVAGAEHGVADGAGLYLIGTELFPSGRPLTGREYARAMRRLADGIDASRLEGALIQNNSWVWQGSEATRAAGRSGSLADRLRGEIGGGNGAESAYLAAIERFAEAGVLVWSLANDLDYPGVPLMAGLPLVDDRFTRAWIAVTDGSVRVRRDAATGLAVRDGDGRLRIRSVDLLSQPCREIAPTCIVTEASGWVADAGSDTGESVARGTSLAAPQVSGALAILKEAFPDAHMHDLRRRLLASANDTFFAPDGSVDFGSGVVKGYSDDYGHGVLDLRAALMPIGRTGFATRDRRQASATPASAAPASAAPASAAPASAAPASHAEPGPLPVPDVPLQAAVLVPGAAMGDAVGRGLAGTRLVVRDALGGRFALDGRALAAERTARRDGGAAGDALRRFLRAGDPAPVLEVATAMAPFAEATAGRAELSRTVGAVTAVMPDAVAFRIGTPSRLPGLPGGLALHAAQDEAGRRTAIAVRQALAPMPGVGLSLGASLIDERDSLLGLRPAHASAAPRGRSGAVAVAALADAGRLAGIAGPGRIDVAVSAEVGAAGPARFGAVGNTGSVGFSSLGAAVGINGLFRRGDRLALSASQPMRIERGTLTLALPHEGNGALAVPLAPSGRQVDLALSWGADLLGAQPTATGGAALAVEAGASLSLDHGHAAGARAAGGYAGLTLRF